MYVMYTYIYIYLCQKYNIYIIYTYIYIYLCQKYKINIHICVYNIYIIYTYIYVCLCLYLYLYRIWVAGFGFHYVPVRNRQIWEMAKKEK